MRRRGGFSDIKGFTKIYESLMNGSLDEAWLAEVGRRDNPFSEVDYRVYAT